MIAIVVGVGLGILTRWEELTPGFAIGLSSSTAWLATAFVVGARSRRSAVAGAAALTAANLGYYATAGFYGPVATWLGLGVLAGATVGRLGALTRRGGAAWVVAATAAFLTVAALERLGLHVTIAGLHLP